MAYTQSGQPTAAIIRDNKAIVDRTLYQTICRSEQEARYILALINSNALAAATAPFMPKGLYGPRHFEKHGWKLPIPRYDASDPLHIQLSELGATAEQECHELIGPERHHDQARRRRAVPGCPTPATPRVAAQRRDRPSYRGRRCPVAERPGAGHARWQTNGKCFVTTFRGFLSTTPAKSPRVEPPLDSPKPMNLNWGHGD